MTVVRVVFIAALVVLVGLAGWWWSRATAHAPVSLSLPTLPLPPLPPELAGDGVLVAWVAHAGARLEPCGCVSGMHGGLVRRASLIAKLPVERRLVLECGGWSGGAADYQRLRTRTYLDAVHQSCGAIVGLGAAEVRLGATHLAGLIGSVDTALVVCANVTRSDGRPLLTNLVRRRIAGRDLVITSVAPTDSVGEGLVVIDPVQALVPITRMLGGASLVVMADMEEAALADLARHVPGIALVVGGKVAQPSREPLAVGAARVIHVANEGKTLGMWNWGMGLCAFDLIHEGIPDHPQVRGAIRAYQEQLATLDLAPDERLAGMTMLGDQTVPGARYVGTISCTACHASAATSHSASKHARALSALVIKGYRHDPDCLRCHVTGLDLPDGFKRRGEDAPQAHLGQVGCESCHGRGSVHVAERSAGRPASGSLQPVTQATCQRCHDAENSPKFDYATYWERIRHGHP